MAFAYDGYGRRRGLDNTNHQEARLDKFIELLSAAISENQQRLQEVGGRDYAETALRPIDVLVGVTAEARSEVFGRILEHVRKMQSEEGTRRRDGHYILWSLEKQLAAALSERAIEIADYGVNGLRRGDREKELQVFGAYGHVLRMVQESSRP